MDKSDWNHEHYFFKEIFKMTKKQITIIRTHYPYLTDSEKEYLKKSDLELKRRNMAREDRVKEIFEGIGIKVDLKTLSFTKLE